MRHDPIDPAQYPGGDGIPVTITEWDERELAHMLDVIEESSRVALAAAEAELEVLERRDVGDVEDRSTCDASMTLAAEVAARERSELEDIAKARRRLATHTFSSCEICHAEIPLFRLHALPTTRVCVSCQARTEKTGTAT